MDIQRTGAAAPPPTQCCAGSGCCPDQALISAETGVTRRRFVALGAAAAAALGMGTENAVAVPSDKGMSAKWLKSITERGRPTEYRGDALPNIGMPVGGIASGQVYLSGDGRLWLWDILNPGAFPAGGADAAGSHYAAPLSADDPAPFATGFAVRWKGPDGSGTRALDREGFDSVVFRGQYPLGRVAFEERGVPVAVALDAYSPFVPTEVDDSSLPATVLEYTLRNTSRRPLSVSLLGFAENPVCLRSRRTQPTTLTAEAFTAAGAAGVQHAARAGEADGDPRQDIVLEDWERTDYSGWTAAGTAFGAGPVTEEECPDYFKRFGPLHITGSRFVTSHNFRDGGAADDYQGKLVSDPFTIERRYLAVNVGGGNKPGTACVNLVADGETVASFTGRDTEVLSVQSLDVSAHQGKSAVIEIVDTATGDWGHVNCDRIWFTDQPVHQVPLDQLPDNGTFALAAAEPGARVRPSVADWSSPSACFDSPDAPAQVDGGRRQMAGTVTVDVDLAPGQSRTVRYVLAWHFDLVDRDLFSFLTGAEKLRRHYGTVFADARAVAGRVGRRGGELSAATHEFVRTWYQDSTLPHWFLERTLAPASTLATSTAWRFQDGRFYAWEGVFCCDGTCTHVWNYAQSAARLFPALERDARERVDFGLAFHPDTGAIDYRGEADRRVAHDGQCGNVLRAYREHQMSADAAFLNRVWPQVKKATEYLVGQDGEPDGILEGAQYNTLDSTWYGEIPWISGLYVAALRAAAEMADDAGDQDFAKRCRSLADQGSATLAGQLWNDRYGYFEQHVDPAHPEAVNSNRGCYLDQMFGQTYAHQLGLDRVFPREKSRTALRSVFHYNFLPDPAGYRDGSGIDGGRVFAVRDEAGTLMCTWPYGGSDTAAGTGSAVGVGYFNEVWTGIEYQFAAHLLAEGLVDQGLAVTRAVHDRYAADRRNPYNEIECSDHYTRAMMGHAVYLAATGFEYHGPRGHIGFAPRISPDDFAAAFTAAEGWGRYRQQQRDGHRTCSLEVRHGRVRVATFATTGTPTGRAPATAALVHGGKRTRLALQATSRDGARTLVTLARPVLVGKGEVLEVELG